VPVGWYVSTKDGRKGPFDTATMEGFVQNRKLTENSLVSHAQYTKGRSIEARKIARFFNLFNNIKESGTPSQPLLNSPPSTVARPVLEQTSTPNGQMIPLAPQQVRRRVTGVTEARVDNSGIANPGPLTFGALSLNSDPTVSGIERFMADGQDPIMVIKLLERVQGICTKGEDVLYMAVQQKPVVNFSPDAIVLSNRRAIIFRQKILGRLEFIDVQWLYVANVHMKENILGATVSIQGTNHYMQAVSHLPKPQARMVYRIAQDMEEQMIEARRQRSMEETRAGAMSVTVNNATPTPAPAAASSDDPLRSLQALYGMHQAGLISEQEFEAKKKDIMDRM